MGNLQFQSFARVSNSPPAGFLIGPRVSDSGFVGFRLGSLVVSESFSIGFWFEAWFPTRGLLVSDSFVSWFPIRFLVVSDSIS